MRIFGVASFLAGFVWFAIWTAVIFSLEIRGIKSTPIEISNIQQMLGVTIGMMVTGIGWVFFTTPRK